MNRSYTLPAAIALAAHALIFFVGSGKPPAQPPVEIKKVVKDPPKPQEEEIFKRAIELVNEEVKTIANNQDSGGGEKTEEVRFPPGIPEFPPIDLTGGDRERQEYKPVAIGPGDKIPTRMPGFGGDGDGSGPGSVITATMLDEPPTTRFQKNPVYPPALRSAGATGTVWVGFLVDENGRVHNVHVIRSTNHAFDDATVEAVSQWRFVPGKRKALPVRFRMSMPVVFSLSE